MDSQDRQRDAVSRVIGMMRRVTRLVQIAPFVYLAFYSVYLILGCFVPDDIVCLADGVMFSSPLATAAMLVLSRVLKLCRWHKAACIIPSASQIEGVVDSYLFTFTRQRLSSSTFSSVSYLSLSLLSRTNTSFTMDSKQILSEILGYYKYKVDNNLCTIAEMESAQKALTENMEIYGTIDDFAKFYDTSPVNVRATISRKLLAKPIRRVFYPFHKFLKIVPTKWRKK